MKRIPALLLAAAMAVHAAPALAQVEGAFDMGVLGMNGAIDHVTKSEAARARGKRPAPAPSQAVSRSLSRQISGDGATGAIASPAAGYRPSRAVRENIATIMADAAEQRKPGTDALRQQFAEMLIVQGIIMAGVHEAAVRGNDTVAVQRYAAMAGMKLADGCHRPGDPWPPQQAKASHGDTNHMEGRDFVRAGAYPRGIAYRHHGFGGGFRLAGQAHHGPGGIQAHQ
ncbi:hypothetical protein [Bordetella petrii]|uniref:hypothetical protein n=1 Tax=Bordetella petrii TaxID=94624 RepID=UPI001E2E1C22|nr:hypothetical protein [Bordetella petrii]MCD0504168.1 hypothetical protein [Bordetella petrii]